MAYNESQPRDENGRWTSGGAGGGLMGGAGPAEKHGSLASLKASLSKHYKADVRDKSLTSEDVIKRDIDRSRAGVKALLGNSMTVRGNEYLARQDFMQSISAAERRSSILVDKLRANRRS